jgi:hypothetical protein
MVEGVNSLSSLSFIVFVRLPFSQSTATESSEGIIDQGKETEEREERKSASFAGCCPDREGSFAGDKNQETLPRKNDRSRTSSTHVPAAWCPSTQIHRCDRHRPVCSSLCSCDDDDDILFAFILATEKVLLAFYVLILNECLLDH